jgi:hypothetical protein
LELVSDVVDPWTLSNFRRLLKKANEFLKSLEPMEKLLSVQDGFSFSRVEALCLLIFLFSILGTLHKVI